MRACIEKEDSEVAMSHAREAADIFRKASDKSGEARALHARGCLELEAFFKQLDADLAYFKKMGCIQQHYKEVDIKAYDESLGFCKRAAELFEEAEDTEGQAMVKQTLQDADQKAAMMNDPTETKQIWKDGKLVDVIRTWNPSESQSDGANPAIADAA